MNQKELFSEFINLGWKNQSINLKKKDLVLGDFIIGRLEGDAYYRIHYLTNGNTVSVPKKWLDIFSVLNTHSGAQIIHLRDKEKDPVSNVIFHMLLFTLFIEIERTSEILGELGSVCEEKTKEFREWIRINHSIDLLPITLLTPDNLIEI